MATNKPANVSSKIWAALGDVETPTDAKMETGWVAEVPKAQVENWVQNRQDAFNAHVNERGIAEWDATTDYIANKSYVQDSSGTVYRAIQNTGPTTVVQNPTTDGTNTYWVVAFAGGSLDVYTKGQSDARFVKNSDLPDASAIPDRLDALEQLDGKLGDTANPGTGAGMVGFDATVEYPSTTVGGAINDLGALAVSVHRLTVASATDGKRYFSFPTLHRLNNGNVLLVYRRAASHAAGGEILCRISQDYGRSWGSPITILSDPAKNYQYCVGGVDPSSGRVVIFSGDFSSNTVASSVYVTSDDNGLTWSAETQLSKTVEYPYNEVPHGRMVSTNHGLMMTFYQSHTASVRFSSDGGLTWSDRVVVYTNTLEDLDYFEPVAVAQNGYPFVVQMILRSSDPKTFAHTYSLDGGLTWTNLTQCQWTDVEQTSVSPVDMLPLWGSNIAICWQARNPDFGMYYVIADDYTLRRRPIEYLRPERTSKRLLEIARAADTSAALAPGFDGHYGYVNMCKVHDGVGGVLVAWYDTPGLNSLVCNVFVKSV